MKTKAVRLYGKMDLRMEEFELPAIKEDEILAYLSANDIPYDTINEDIISFGGRKVYYNLLLDDRAGLREVYDLLTRFLKEVEDSHA